MYRSTYTIGKQCNTCIRYAECNNDGLIDQIHANNYDHLGHLNFSFEYIKFVVVEDEKAYLYVSKFCADPKI